VRMGHKVQFTAECS